MGALRSSEFKSLKNDMVYGDEPLAVEEWLKKKEEEVKENDKLER